MRKVLLVLVTLGFMLVFVAACGRSFSASPPANSTPAGTPAPGGNGNVTEVHMGIQSFKQSSVTVKKGESLTLVNDASDIHLISLGQWVNGSPKPETEPGAPQVHSL